MMKNNALNSHAVIALILINLLSCYSFKSTSVRHNIIQYVPLSHLKASTDSIVNEVVNKDVSRNSVFTRDLKSADELSLKYQILHLGATLDRGQLYNPTSGDHYISNMNTARMIIDELISKQINQRYTLEQMDGEWELIFSTVKHGIFRSSPFFLAIQEAYRQNGEADKAELFFKLHELQTFSFGLSKIGRVAQIINAQSNQLISEFDTSIFSLTALPFVGFWKLLPTFGGCVVTVSKCTLNQENGVDLDMEVEYTTAKKIEGLNGLFGSSFDVKVPINQIW